MSPYKLINVTEEMILVGVDAALSFPEVRQMRHGLLAAIVSASYQAMRALEPNIPAYASVAENPEHPKRIETYTVGAFKDGTDAWQELLEYDHHRD